MKKGGAENRIPLAPGRNHENRGAAERQQRKNLADRQIVRNHLDEHVLKREARHGQDHQDYAAGIVHR